MSEINEGTDRPLLDETAHSIIWQIRDAARYLGSIIPKVKSASRHRRDRTGPQAWREAWIPQRMNRLVIAHLAIEDGFRNIIKRLGESYKWGHNLRVLLDQWLRRYRRLSFSSLSGCRDAHTGSDHKYDNSFR